MNFENQKSFNFKSSLLILVGAVLLGLTLGKIISQFEKNNQALDEIVIIEDLPEENNTVFLDLSAKEHPRVEEKQIESQVQAFAETRYTHKEALEDYFSKVPKHITIPAINLESDISYSGVRDVPVDGEIYQQWIAPNDVVGWHYDSAVLGEIGNTVLNGHHNIFGEVFKDLHKLHKGDEIIIESETGARHYVVATTMILPERYESKEVRLQNARWIQKSEDERITLITCWPYNSNTHRVIVVAYPTGQAIPPN